ncbi:MAG: GNAT family N-acetyltransferase [Saprospiraceae bacterium]
MIQFTTANNTNEIQQILDLQYTNLPKNISTEEAKEQGFVTVHHDFEILSAMNVKYPHVIAKTADKVIGYTLVMLPEFGNKIPVLVPLFDKINALSYNGDSLKAVDYFVMGQVCVDKAYRGKGVFAGLYQQMKTEMSPYFKYIITEIATRNTRSMRAHEKVGFETIHIFSTPKEEWAIVAWDWQ